MSGLKRNADEILEALESGAQSIKRALGKRQRDQASAIRDRNNAVRDRDSELADRPGQGGGGNGNGNGNGRPPTSGGPDGPRAQIDPGKFDYLFGRVTGPHNGPRSAQNAAQLARVGVHDTPAGRRLLQEHFDDAIARTDNVLDSWTNQRGRFEVRDSLFSGPGGFLHFESTWQVLDGVMRMTTVIPKGGR